MNNKKDIELIRDNIPNVPSIYYGGVSNMFGKIDPYASKIMARATLPGGTAIAMTVNLIKDPKNKGKVIASTTLASGITYWITSIEFATVAGAGMTIDAMVITEAIVGAVAASAGIALAPLTITIISAGALAVVMTSIGSEIYNKVYDELKHLENEYDKSLLIEIFAPDIRGTITKEEFILKSLKDDKDFCKRIFPKYQRYKQIVKIENYDMNNTLKSFIYNDKINKQASIQEEDLEKARVLTDLIVSYDTSNKLKKHDITIKTTNDNEEYTIMRQELLESIAKDNNTTVKKILNFKENKWVNNENRY